MLPADLLARARALTEPCVELLSTLVRHESPTGDVERALRLAGVLAGELERRGARLERHEAPGYGEHLLARFAGSDGEGKPLLVVGHLDTVHPVGALELRVEDGCVRGPGAFDMKGGLAVVLTALDLLAEAELAPRRDVAFLITCEEEVGSPTSAPTIEALAREAQAALVLEPSLPGGAVKVQRKGFSQYRLVVRGRAAHAGIEPEAGASAVHELARQIVEVVALRDEGEETTANVGVVSGGTAANTVAAEARASVDVRSWTRAEEARVARRLDELAAVDPRCTVEVERLGSRAALERSPEGDALFEIAREEAALLGVELASGRTGGGSDGNLTAGVGCPTLDGLGPDGGGAHSPGEHVRIADLPFRIALLSRLLLRL